ncbi:MAG: hypothetical protein ABJZ55_06310 [Fuerstiella sp.]
MRQDFQQHYQKRNEETRDLLESFQGHREKVMQLVTETANQLLQDESAKMPSVALLGAGNCLDVDLNKLQERFETIHLVDVDGDSIAMAASESANPAQCELHAPFDVASPLMSLTRRDFEATNTEAMAAALQALSAENLANPIVEADVVVSLCLLSQLVETLSGIIGENHAAFSNALKAVRIGHLRRMLNMLRPGGVAILISDVVSSVSAPELVDAKESELPDLVRKLVTSRNFFSGTNPAAVLAELNLLTKTAGGPESVHTIDPWKWQPGERTFAVYGMRIQKTQPDSDEPSSDQSDATDSPDSAE